MGHLAHVNEADRLQGAAYNQEPPEANTIANDDIRGKPAPNCAKTITPPCIRYQNECRFTFSRIASRITWEAVSTDIDDIDMVNPPNVLSRRRGNVFNNIDLTALEVTLAPDRNFFFFLCTPSLASYAAPRHLLDGRTPRRRRHETATRRCGPVPYPLPHSPRHMADNHRPGVPSSGKQRCDGRSARRRRELDRPTGPLQRRHGDRPPERPERGLDGFNERIDAAQ